MVFLVNAIAYLYFTYVFFATSFIAIVEPARFGCLNGQLKWYDNSTHDCKNGTIIQITTPTTTLLTTPKPTCQKGSIDVLKCNGGTYCGKTDGYKCCGFKKYHPDFDTCCQKTQFKMNVHKDKAESKHVCCRDDIWTIQIRGSPDLRCNHPSRNDVFWRTRTLNKKTANSETCSNPYAFKLTMIHRSANDMKYLVRVKQLSLRANVEQRRGRGEVKQRHDRGAVRRRRDHREGKRRRDGTSKLSSLAYDVYTPKKDLSKIQYLVLSKHNYLSAEQVYAFHDDKVFQLGKSGKKMRRRLKKFMKICKKYHQT